MEELVKTLEEKGVTISTGHCSNVSLQTNATNMEELVKTLEDPSIMDSAGH